MSIKVALEDVAGEVARRGPGYLLTTDAGSRPHVMHLTFTVDGDQLRTTVGRSAARNVGAQPAVTLLWPPEEPGGYTLIVDATAELDGELMVAVTPVGAVLHRPA
jgi:hypothetical protein